jgi:ribonuclease HII
MPTKPLSDALVHFDRDVLQRVTLPLIGVDEVGRGSWVGPVIAAAVHIPPVLLVHPPDWFYTLNDSKKVKPADRTALAALLQAHVSYALAEATITDIETLNLHHASLLASHRAVAALTQQNQWQYAHVLIDGCYPLPQCSHTQQALVKGDGLSVHIAAASILAKVHRDSLLQQWHQTYPQYQWASNKGYGTPVHVAAIHAHGPCPLHRPRFLKKWQTAVSSFK